VNVFKVYFSAKSWFLKYKSGILHGYIMKNKVGVGFIPKPKIQLNFSKIQRQSYGKNTVGARATLTLMFMQQQSQKELLSICDEIKVDEVGYWTEKRKNFVSDDVSRRNEAVPFKSSTRGDTPSDFIVTMLCNNEVGLVKQDTEMNFCVI